MDADGGRHHRRVAALGTLFTARVRDTAGAEPASGHARGFALRAGFADGLDRIPVIGAVIAFVVAPGTDTAADAPDERTPVAQ